MAASNHLSDNSAIILRRLGGYVGHTLLGVRHLLYCPPGEVVTPNPWIVALKFTFDPGSVYLKVDADWDTIVVTMTSPRRRKHEHWLDVSKSEPWQQWLGTPLRYVWACINQSGFVDGVQLGLDNNRPSIMLLAVANSIREHVLLEANSSFIAHS